MGTVKPDFEPLPNAEDLALFEIQAEARRVVKHLFDFFSGLSDRMRQFSESIKLTDVQVEQFNRDLARGIRVITRLERQKYHARLRGRAMWVVERRRKRRERK